MKLSVTSREPLFAADVRAIAPNVDPALLAYTARDTSAWRHFLPFGQEPPFRYSGSSTSVAIAAPLLLVGW